MTTPGTVIPCRAAIARGVLVLAAMLLLPLAAALQTPRSSAAQSTGQDSLWVGKGIDDGSKLAACGNPSSQEALAACFGTPVDSQGVWIMAMATDGVNVYYAGNYGGLSCPIANLGANCTRIMAGPWPGGDSSSYEVLSIAASAGVIWIGQQDGKIYRCPANLPYQQQNSAPSECTLLDNAVDRAVASLLLANGKLYAGLEPYGTSTKKQGLIWECQPNVENQCSTFYNTGNAWASSMVAGGGYLWAAMTNNYLSRCNPDLKSCENWDWAGNWPDYYLFSISYDGADTVYAAVGVSGNRSSVIWSCPTASPNSCGNVLSNVNGSSVAAGLGSVFSSTQSGLFFGTTPFAGASSELYSDVNSADSWLIYIPAEGLTGVGGVAVKVSAPKLGRQIAKRCQAGRNPKATVTVEGPNGVSKTVKAGACALAKGGAVKRTFNLLDPGDYTVMVRARKHTGQASFTIEQNKTRPVNVKLSRSSAGS